MYRCPRANKAQPANEYLKAAETEFFFDRSKGIYKPKAYRSENEASDGKKNRGKWVRFVIGTFISVATFAVVALYAYYAKLQWCEMKRTADTSIQNIADFEDVQRARLVITEHTGKFIPRGNKYYVVSTTLSVKNAGQTIAEGIRIERSEGFSVEFPWGTKDIHPSPADYGDTISPGETKTITNEMITNSDITKYNASEWALVSYRDIFGKADAVPSCIAYDVRHKMWRECEYTYVKK